MNRRGFLAGVIAVAVDGARAASPSRETQNDLETLWREIDAGYAYFDGARRQAWNALRGELRRRGLRAKSPAESMGVLEAAIARLRDDGVMLFRPGLASHRVPYDLDIWPHWREGHVVVASVRTFSDADAAGVHPGQRIVAIDGAPVQRAVQERLGETPASESAAEWALRRLLVEKRGRTLRLDVREHGASSVVDVEPGRGAYGNAPAVLGRRMGNDRDIGYVRVRMGPDPAIATQFEAAFASVSRARALILDLRDGSGPSPRAAVTAIVSRLAVRAGTWQLRQSGSGPRIADTVMPGRASSNAPLAVLVDRWTAGEAEAVAAGLKAVADARIVGTATAGLHGEPVERKLPATGAVLRFPAERTFMADGTPREGLEPDVRVDLAAPSGGPGDPILYQALKLLERR